MYNFIKYSLGKISIEKIALFGGSFDPPHLGHIEIVYAALSLLDIDKIVIMPTFLNPFKESSKASAPLRFSWLNEIFMDEERVEVSSYEVGQGRKVSSYETVKYLKKSYEKIYLIIGADNLASLESWTNYTELESEVEFVIASRDAINIDQKYKTLDINYPISSSALRVQMQESFLPKEIAKEIKEHYK